MLGERHPRVEQHRVADRQPQRAVGGRQHRVEAAVDVGELLLDGGQRGRPRQLRGAPQAVVEDLALRAFDVAGDEDPGDEQHRRQDGGHAEGQAAAKVAHGAQIRSTKPTPRTVCSTRGSPAASSLRRR